MSTRTDDLYLVDIIESADSIRTFLGHADESTFSADDALRSAVLWKLFIVAEATSKLSAASRAALGTAPWEDIRGFRNRMAHGYFTLNWARIWEIARESVPSLASQAEKVLADRFQDTYRRLKERQRVGEFD